MAANLISLLRVLLLPLALASLRQDGQTCSPATVALLLTAAATDLLDGYVARRFHQVSRLGQVLDPLADKIFLGGLGAALFLWRDFPLWLLAMLLGRDLGIVLAGLFLLRRRLIIPANRFGKATTVCTTLTALSYAFGLSPALNRFLAAAAGLLLVLSALSYLRLLRRTLAAPAADPARS
jgi:CDP-diacylglycerol--glycerol-3-phosphate 3-phosphatidyltransferase